MVRSKEAPKKKPKDPLLTTPSKPRGDFLDEGRPWNRGGAAMSPAPATVPSYMRGTSSSDAKAGRRGRPAAPVSASASPARWMTAVSVPASPARRMTAASVSVSASASPARRRPVVRVLSRGKVLFPEEAPGSGPGLGRATCSSTMKEAKFPDALDLAPGATDAEGPAALRVCPYTYCSLNGHVHAPAVPLRSFLASRRRLIKTQQSMKLKGVSAFRKKSADKTSGGGGGAKIAPLIDEEAVGDFFVEVYAGPRVSSDMSCSDMSLDEMDATVRRMEFLVFDRCGTDDNSEKGNDLAACEDGEPEPHLRLQEKHGACRDSLSECSGADISGDFVEELPWVKYHGYEYDSLDDEISEEQRMREEAAVGAEISEEHAEDREEEQGTSGRSAGECKEDADEDQKTTDEVNTSILARETEFVADQGVACRVESSEDPDGRDEDNILDTVYCGEASAGQGTTEENLSEDFCKSRIPDQEVTGWVETILEESCKEETSMDPEANDEECSVESDGESEVTEDQDVEDEESTTDDGAEVEISENTISGDGSREDFSEKVTSRAIPEDDSTVDYAFDQYAGTVDDVFGQDGSKLELDSEETATVQQTDQGGSMDGMEDGPKELETTSCILEEAVEESGLAQESSLGGVPTCVVDGAQVEPDITICMSKGCSEESGVTEECGLDNNAENFTDDTERGREITRCNLEAASEETGVDQDTVEDNIPACISDNAQNDLQVTNCKLEDTSKESATTQEAHQCDSSANANSDAQGTVEDDDCACVSDDAQNDLEISKHTLDGASKESAMDQDDDQSDSSANASSDAQETIEDDDFACVSDDAQNDLEISKHILEGVSKESAMAQDDDRSDSSANVSSDAENESELTRSELAVIAISDDIKNESKLSTCKSEDVFEESIIGQEIDHDDMRVGDGAQNEYEVTTCHSEDAQVESDVTQEDEDNDNTAGAEKKLEITACGSGGASLEPAMPEEADGDINTTEASHNSQKDTTMQNFDASEDIHFTEETNLSFSEQIPAEFTDAEETSIDDICGGAFSGMNLKGDVYFDLAESATCPRNKLIISRRRRTPEEEEYLRGFNPRAPNFLPLELDPDAEKVDLKHQMMDERKNAEEWMIDYALRRAVTNLGPARKKKVELLVQAFETVLPHDEDDKKNVSPTRPVQACN